MLAAGMGDSSLFAFGHLYMVSVGPYAFLHYK